MTTKEFLRCFPKFCIQTFDDNQEEGHKKNNSLSVCAKPSAFTKERIEELNEAGAGIYFTPNQFPTGIRGKKPGLCTGVNAWIVECDELPIDEQWKNLQNSPLPPSFIVQSKKSLHAYWLAKDATIENYEEVIKGLIVKFQGDPACKDVSRVFRIPGFYHQKNPKEPILIGLVDEHPERVYTEEEMLKAFPYVKETPKVYQKTQTLVNDFWGVIGNLENKMVLQRLSGQSIVNNETIEFTRRNPVGEHILVNKVPCDGWLDEQGMIGSGKRGGPTWIQWIGYYGKSKADIAKWAKENLSEFIPEELKTIDGKAFNTETSFDLIDEMRSDFNQPKSTYSWGMSYLDYKLPIIEKNESYILIFGQSGSGKTLFTLWMAKQIAKTNKNVYFLSLEMTKKQMLKRFCRQKEGISKEQYRNREYDTEKLLSHLDEIKEVNFIGIDKGEVYDLDKIDKIITEKKPSVLFIDNFNKIEYQGKTELETDRAVSKGLLNLNRKHKIPIIVIHHANKLPSEKSRNSSPYNLRGLSGMRGSNKIIDDLDIGIEIARPKVDLSQQDVPNVDKNACYIAVYKDRDNDEKSLVKLQFHKGEYLDEMTYNTVLSFDGTLI